MATATKELPALDPIWPCGKKIKVIGVTGPVNSGKTLFGMLIDPEHTLLIDTEDSSGTYDSGAKDESEELGVTRIALYDVMMQKTGGKEFTPKEMYVLFENKLKVVKPGQYSVIMVDVWSDIEAGAVEYIKSRYASFGYKSEESFFSTGGIFWEKVNSHLKKLINEIAAKCQSFVFVVHLKKEWKHGKPTDNVLPKGKAPLMESASLYLYLERDRDEYVPSAIPLKARLASFRKEMRPDPETGIMKPTKRVINFLPLRLPVATADAIRHYIVNPPNIEEPAEGETYQPKVLDEHDKLSMQKAIEEKRAEAAAIELEAKQIDKVLYDAKSATKNKLKGRKTTATVEDIPNDEPASETYDKPATASRKDEADVPEDQESGRNRNKENSQVSATEVHADEAIAAANAAKSIGVHERLYKSVKKTLEKVGKEAPPKLSDALKLLTTEQFHTVLDWIDEKQQKSK